MPGLIEDQGAAAGHAVAAPATNVGHTIAAGGGTAVEFATETSGMGGSTEQTNKGIAGVMAQMSVIASCGKKVGVVDRIEGNAIKLTKTDSPDGQHHFIPIGWIERVNSHVYLRKSSKETEQGWKSNAESCQCEWAAPIRSSRFFLIVEAVPGAAAIRPSRSANGLARADRKRRRDSA